jgi:hypothetical protein
MSLDLVGLGIDRSKAQTCSTLQAGIRYALHSLGKPARS